MVTKTITIVAATTVGHELTRKAIDRTQQQIRTQQVIVVSDQNFYPGSQFVAVESSFDKKDYNMFMLKHLINFVQTDYVLIVQYDGMAVNKQYWDDEFFKYDYIGAPWLWRPQGLQVGNGGFSLRSRKLLEAVNATSIEAYDDLNEDQIICDSLRSQLETQHDIAFAPVRLAHKFSHEREAEFRYSFGFHGVFNVPFYFTAQETHDFITDLPLRDQGTQLEIIPYCYSKGYIEQAEYAIALGRQANPEFDKIFMDYVNSIPGRFNFLLDKYD